MPRHARSEAEERSAARSGYGASGRRSASVLDAAPLGAKVSEANHVVLQPSQIYPKRAVSGCCC
jgi:hypothetical protein